MRNNFRVEDITFKKARMQNEILNELPTEQITSKETLVPTSRTPEQITSYFRSLIDTCKDNNLIDLYNTIIEYIGVMGEQKKMILELETEVARLKSMVEKSDTEDRE